jgi:regulatory protein
VKNREVDLQGKAKNYAFLLLKFRPRSEKEIILRLKQKKFEDRIIKETLDFLKDRDFIDDESFARGWVRSRIDKPLGLRKIRQELKIKGIDQETINNQIAAIKEGYCEETIVAKIVKDRFSKLKGIAPDKARRRIFDYLLRRGFSPDIVRDTLFAKAKGVPTE